MRHTSRVAAALSAGLLVLTLTACGDDDEPTAVEPTPSASPSDSTPTDAAGDDTAPASGEEALDAQSQAFLDRLRAGMGEEGSVHVVMTMTGPMETSAEGDTTYGPDGSDMRLTMQMGDMPGEMELVVADGQAYVSIPGVTEPGKFFEVDEDNPLFAGLDAGLSPTDSFDAFEAGLERVEELGADEIDGEDVTQYRLHVDAEQALEATGQPPVPGLPETLTYDVWLDSDNRMRRLVYELAGTELRMDMTDWGKDVTIAAPDESELEDAPPAM